MNSLKVYRFNLVYQEIVNKDIYEIYSVKPLNNGQVAIQKLINVHDESNHSSKNTNRHSNNYKQGITVTNK